MAKEHEKNPSILQNNEFIASTSQGLLCEHKDSKVNYFDLGLCESCYKDESGIFSDIDDEEVTNKYNVLCVSGLSKYAYAFRDANDCYIVFGKPIFRFWTWSFW